MFEFDLSVSEEEKTLIEANVRNFLGASLANNRDVSQILSLLGVAQDLSFEQFKADPVGTISANHELFSSLPDILGVSPKDLYGDRVAGLLFHDDHEAPLLSLEAVIEKIIRTSLPAINTTLITQVIGQILPIIDEAIDRRIEERLAQLLPRKEKSVSQKTSRNSQGDGFTERTNHRNFKQKKTSIPLRDFAFLSLQTPELLAALEGRGVITRANLVRALMGTGISTALADNHASKITNGKVRGKSPANLVA